MISRSNMATYILILPTHHTANLVYTLNACFTQGFTIRVAAHNVSARARQPPSQGILPTNLLTKKQANLRELVSYTQPIRSGT